MKKLLLLATSLSCIAASAEGLSSANVVGWADKALKQNYQAFAPYFFNVGKDSIKLTDLTVAGYEGDYCDGDVRIQLLDSLGNPSATYTWYEGLELRPGPGWYRGSKLIDAESAPTFNKGDGLWVRAKSGSFIKMAGEVFMHDITFELRNDFQMIGNPYATSVSLANMKVEGYSGNYCDGDVRMQVLDALGNTVATYTWYEGLELRPGPGWYRGSKLVSAENDNLISLAPGEALWVRARGDNLKLIVKTPLEKK